MPFVKCEEEKRYIITTITAIFRLLFLNGVGYSNNNNIT